MKNKWIKKYFDTYDNSSYECFDFRKLYHDNWDSYGEAWEDVYRRMYAAITLCGDCRAICGSTVYDFFKRKFPLQMKSGNVSGYNVRFREGNSLEVLDDEVIFIGPTMAKRLHFDHLF